MTKELNKYVQLIVRAKSLFESGYDCYMCHAIKHAGRQLDMLDEALEIQNTLGVCAVIPLLKGCCGMERVYLASHGFDQLQKKFEWGYYELHQYRLDMFDALIADYSCTS